MQIKGLNKPPVRLRAVPDFFQEEQRSHESTGYLAAIKLMSSSLVWRESTHDWHIWIFVARSSQIIS